MIRKQGIKKYKSAQKTEKTKSSKSKTTVKASAKSNAKKVSAKKAGPARPATRSEKAQVVKTVTKSVVKKVAAKVTAKVNATAKSRATTTVQAYAKVAETRVSAPDKVRNAVDQQVDNKKESQGEEQLQKELVQELEKEKKQTSTLVREDRSPANANREQLIVEYAPLIKYIAQKIAARLPANIELDDLISSGVIGLMDAIDKYDSSRDNKFKTYAEFRIRGAILDELRAQDWVPRSVREKAKILERCYAKIEQERGRQATDEEVCAELGLSKEDYHEMLNQVRSVSLLSFDDVSNFSKADKRSLHGIDENGPKAPTPFSEVNVASLKRMIADAIQDLPEKQRLVLSLYYYEDLNLKEIGRVLDVTESRVSQLHTQAILRLKGRLRNHWDEFVSLVG